MTKTVHHQLIAPCGMNCQLCSAYQREKKRCPGCRAFDADEPVSIARCTIKNCPEWNKTPEKFCYTCSSYPCARLKRLDKRYRTKYHMSMIENLDYIKNKGLKAFLSNEQKRWTCPNCGGVICIHHHQCSTCKAPLISK